MPDDTTNSNNQSQTQDDQGTAQGDTPTVSTPPFVTEESTPPMPTEESTPPTIMPKEGDGSAAPSSDIKTSEVIASAQPKKKFAGGRVVATILGLFLLVGGIGAGVVLVNQQQDIREKASTYATFCSEKGLTSGCYYWDCKHKINCGTGEMEDGFCVYGYGGTACSDVENACQIAGGTCYEARNCTDVAKSLVNSGNGCYNPSQVCCGGSAPTPTEQPPSTTACQQAGGSCYNVRNCSDVGGSLANSGNGCGGTGQLCCSTPPQISCQDAMGACYDTPSCNGIGKSIVNGGNGCGGTGQICCSAEVNPAPSACQSAGGSCYDTPSCNGIGKSIVNGGNGCGGTGQICCGTSSSISASCIYDNMVEQCELVPDLGWQRCQSPVGEMGYSAACDNDDPTGTKVDFGCSSSYPNCVPGGYCINPSQSCNPTDVTKNCVPDPTCSTDGGGEYAQCFAIKMYDKNWALLDTAEKRAGLAAGDVIRFSVIGSASSGVFDKARFTINGTLRPEVTNKKSGTEEYYDEYTIPAGVTSFNISAEVHHASLGWK